MEEKIKPLYELCETISQDIEECNEKIRKAGGKLSAGDVDYLDKLTHTMKSIKTVIAMMEAEDEESGYSGRNMPMYGGMSYARGGNSYAGRSNARRDSMGRYSRGGNSYARGYSRADGYSYADGMEELIDEMRGMMDGLPEEKRREVQRFVEKMGRM